MRPHPTRPTADGETSGSPAHLAAFSDGAPAPPQASLPRRRRCTAIAARATVAAVLMRVKPTGGSAPPVDLVGRTGEAEGVDGPSATDGATAARGASEVAATAPSGSAAATDPVAD